MAIVRDVIVKKGEMFGGAGVATLTTYYKGSRKSATKGSDVPLDLNNLPFDPAEEAMKSSRALSTSTPEVFMECVLAQSEGYRETLFLKAIPATPSLVELSIKTQLLGTKHPTERRVKSRTCVELSELEDLYKSLGQFLTAKKTS